MIRYAEELTRTARSQAATIEDLKKDFSDREIVDLCYAVCVANMSNRINDSLGVELETSS